MALILNVQLEIPHLVDDTGQLLARQAQEDAIVDVDNEYDITTIENSVINERLLEVDLLQFVNQITIPNLPSLFLTITARTRLHRNCSDKKGRVEAWRLGKRSDLPYSAHG